MKITMNFVKLFRLFHLEANSPFLCLNKCLLETCLADCFCLPQACAAAWLRLLSPGFSICITVG